MVAIVADLREQLRYSALGPVPTYIKKLLAIVADLCEQFRYFALGPVPT